MHGWHALSTATATAAQLPAHSTPANRPINLICDICICIDYIESRSVNGLLSNRPYSHSYSVTHTYTLSTQSANEWSSPLLHSTAALLPTQGWINTKAHISPTQSIRSRSNTKAQMESREITHTINCRKTSAVERFWRVLKS